MPAKYAVTIDTTKGSFDYYYVDAQGNQHECRNLNVTARDTVSFTAKTPGNKPHCAAICFLGQTPFIDQNGIAIYALLWSEQDETNPQELTVEGALASYEYRVVVFDRGTGKGKTDDPKVIIGTGGLGLRLKELELIEEEIKKISLRVEEKLKAIETKLNLLVEKSK